MASPVKRANIEMKATERYFPVVVFIMLYKMVLTFESVDDILKSVTIQVKATEQCTFLWCCLLHCTRWL